MLNLPSMEQLLIDQYNGLEIQRQAVVQRQRSISKAITSLRVAAKPEFPTVEQIEGIDLAIKHIRSGGEDKSHHGTRMNPSVQAHAERGWISVNHKAPYAHQGAGKCWGFTKDDEDLILGVIQVAFDCRINEFWQHEYGLSVIIDKGE